jgi:hypothetical protein
MAKPRCSLWQVLRAPNLGGVVLELVFIDGFSFHRHGCMNLIMNQSSYKYIHIPLPAPLPPLMMPSIIPRIMIIIKLCLRYSVALRLSALLSVRPNARPRLFPNFAVARLSNPTSTVPMPFFGERSARGTRLLLLLLLGVDVVQAVHAALVVLTADVEVEGEGGDGRDAI